MRQTKTFYLILGLIATIVLILAFQLRVVSHPQNIPKPIIQVEEQKQQFLITGTNLTGRDLETQDTIKINFSDNIDFPSLSYSINPQEETIPYYDPSLKQLTIEPTNAWDFDITYTLTIHPSTKTKSGVSLNKEYQFTFKTTPYKGI